MADATKLQIIGGGQMGLALAAGVVRAGWASSGAVRVVEPSAEQRARVAEAIDGVEVAEQATGGVDTLVAVKPHLVEPVVAELPTPSRVISVAAGITTAAISAAVGDDSVPVLRVMPNTPALVGEGASAVAPGAAADDDDVAWAVELLSAVGAVEVVTEAQLDAVTGLSGSGPAYVFLVAEALTDAGVAAGLPRSVAEGLANQTLLGAATMLVEDPRSATELRAAVTTPAGTTAAGLTVLERRGVRAALIDAVAAARDRAAELGRS